jgi:uncharacterized repeat protein (TIGR03803 family)
MGKIATVSCSVIGLAVLLLPSAAQAAPFKTLYAFAGGSDGASPYAGLIIVGGYLYGTTIGGGAANEGTVFRIKRSTGAETLLHSFGGSGDGRQPQGVLVNLHGTLYGTTSHGGAANGYGTVFTIDPTTGAETVLHTFTGGSGGSDGALPLAGLINVGGTLYGTTSIGNSENSGTVFSIDPTTGADTILYNFDANNGDGYQPYGALIYVHGTFYGTTTSGGASSYGTVFKIKRATRAESIVYAFAGNSDGGGPFAGVINVGGILYGTTVGAGASPVGTVFAVNPATGAETVLHRFGSGSDGLGVTTGLVNVNGTLYGTTGAGGASGDGTVYSIDPGTGAEAIVYSFTGGSDGKSPNSSLLNRRGVLYGTTSGGGANNFGTVFQLTP